MPPENRSNRDEVVDTITALFLATDRRDWPGVEAVLADSVQFDMTSMAGGEPSVLTPQDITSAWAQGLAPIQVVHHQVSNFSIQLGNDAATASCYGIAFHFRKVVSGRNVRTFVGSYDFHLIRTESSGWRIDLFRFNLGFVDGNLDLHSEESAA